MHSVLLEDRGIVHPSQIHNTLDRVENRHFFGDELESISVSRDDQNLVAGLLPLDAERSK